MDWKMTENAENISSETVSEIISIFSFHFVSAYNHMNMCKA